MRGLLRALDTLRLTLAGPSEPDAGHYRMLGQLSADIDAALVPLQPSGGRCALLDFPAHSNVGDSAIWLGESVWLRRHRARVVYACDVETYSPGTLAARLGGGTILLHGGGNLGDLWEQHQRFRETVIRDFPDNPIVQLPQTIHFRDAERIVAAQRAFNAHRDLTLLCRDEPSLAFARAHFMGRSMLCPDMAFALGRLRRPGKAAVDIVWLARTDIESADASAPATSADIERGDWLAERGTPLYHRHRALNAQLAAGGVAHDAVVDRLIRTCDRLARERVLRGCRMLSRGRVVITDRLHGHILCLLLGIPHVVLDNNYGKVRGFHEQWTRSSHLTRWAASPAEALDAARAMARTPVRGR